MCHSDPIYNELWARVGLHSPTSFLLWTMCLTSRELCEPQNGSWGRPLAQVSVKTKYVIF